MFEGEKVKLRAIELTDLDAIMEHFNDLKMRTFLSTPLPISREEEEEWIRRSWQAKQEGKEFQFAIEHKETEEFLGSAGLFDINKIALTAELGVTIHAEKNWSKGYGTDTVKVLLKIGFDYLNLHRIQLRVYDFNERAIKTYEKVGFIQVGKLREAQYINGQYIDVILMDILANEYKKIVDKEFK